MQFRRWFKRSLLDLDHRNCNRLRWRRRKWPVLDGLRSMRWLDQRGRRSHRRFGSFGRTTGSAQLNDQPGRIVQARSCGLYRCFQIQHYAGDTPLRLRHPNLPDKMIRHRNRGHTLASQDWLGVREIEEQPVGIVQTIRFHLKVAVRLDGDTRHAAERPEANRGDVMRLLEVRGEQRWEREISKATLPERG